MPRGRPPYVPTVGVRKLLWELEDLTGQLEAIKTEREELIDDLLKRKVPALQVAKAANVQPSTLSMRGRRRRVASENGV